MRRWPGRKLGELSSYAAISPRRATRHAHSSASEIPQDVLTANESINAFVQIAEKQSDRSIEDYSAAPLHGMRVAVKDTICTKAPLKTTASSAMLEAFSSPYDATVVKLLRKAGAEIVGKTNCDEFGMGSFNIHSIHGPVVNPFQVPSDIPWVEREQRSAGGSSGGSAAAVAAGLCDAALATDTGGSTRLPASFCGVVGLKPSYGLISRWGVIAFADSLDCVGLMSKRVAGVKKLLNILASHDQRDPSAASESKRAEAKDMYERHTQAWRFSAETGFSNMAGLRIGIPQEYFPQELDQSTRGPLKRILHRLKAAGASVVPVSLPATRFALSAYYVIASAEAHSNLARYSGIHYGSRVEPPADSDKTNTGNVYAYTRTACFGEEVKKRLLLGGYALTADAFDNFFLQAHRVRKQVQDDFNIAFRWPNVLRKKDTSVASGVDVLMHPSAIGTAPPLSLDGLKSGLEAYVQDVLTVPASLAGLPAVSVPAGVGSDGWPVGLSVVGQWGQDELVLRVAEAVEAVAEL